MLVNIHSKKKKTSDITLEEYDILSRCDYEYLRGLFGSHAPCLLVSLNQNSPPAQQNSDAMAPTAGGAAAHRSAKEQSARRKEDAKQAAKKPKENALSQFDLNNYASK